MVSMAAPAPLEPVRQFVNTLDLETGEDELADGAGLRRWLSTQRLAVTVAPTSRDVERAVALREALREALAANHDRSTVPADARDVINDSVARADLTVEFTADQRWRVSPRGRGVDGALGSLLAIVTDAMTDGSWSRLKVCSNDACRWAFYDGSRARTAKWCSMQICGNRVKQQKWRERRAAP